MSGDLIKYNVWCIEQDKYTIAYGTEDAPPTACTDPAAHTSRAIDASETKKVVTLDPEVQKMLIVEETTPDGYSPTGGHIRTKGVLINIEPGLEGSPDPQVITPVITEHIESLDINTSVLSYIVYCNDDNLGDTMDIVASKDTTIGVITASVDTETTVLQVSPTVIQYAVKGYFISLTNGVTKDDLGYITDIDPVYSTITVQFPPSNSYAAMTTAVKITRGLFEGCYFHNTYPIHTGHDKIGGSFVPAETTMHFIYTNNTAVAKKLWVTVELLY